MGERLVQLSPTTLGNLEPHCALLMINKVEFAIVVVLGSVLPLLALVTVILAVWRN